MGKPRRSINRKLETYVYRRAVKGVDYFYYQHPLMTRKGLKPIGFKQEWQKANEFAREANAKFSPHVDQLETLFAQVETPQITKTTPRQEQRARKLKATMRQVIEAFEKQSPKYEQWKSAEGTWRDTKGHLRDLKQLEGDEIFSELTADMVGTIINEHRKGSGRRKMRQTLSGIFTWAVNKGYAERNVALDYTLEKGEKFTERERSRMSWEDFSKIRDRASEQGYEWVADAMELALITAQGRAEVVSWTFKDNIIREGEKQFLTFERQKTANKKGGSWQKIEIGEDLKRVLAKCRERSLSVGCPYVISVDTGRLVGSKDKTHRAQCTPEHLSKMMAKISSDLDVKGSVFHEIRSLSCRIYFKQHGFEFVQALTNHSQAKMTEEYLKGDERVYQEGFADLDLAMIPRLKIIN